MSGRDARRAALLDVVAAAREADRGTVDDRCHLPLTIRTAYEAGVTLDEIAVEARLSWHAVARWSGAGIRARAAGQQADADWVLRFDR
ncbi:hypothetical protein GCM10023169_08560 [Georgenia halophila]|uniref:Helix-turn-helix domain-containing protein n=1 Tax=Georgenia halophila TaxID=620889 RepID=A0ABP8KXI8_9MICO